MKKHEELGQEPSSPTPFYNGDELYCDNNGFTKREAIAAKALAALITNSEFYDFACPQETARSAVAHADALLKELSNE